MKILLLVACLSAAYALTCKRCIDSDSTAFDTVISKYASDIPSCAASGDHWFQCGSGYDKCFESVAEVEWNKAKVKVTSYGCSDTKDRWAPSGWDCDEMEENLENTLATGEENEYKFSTCAEKLCVSEKCTVYSSSTTTIISMSLIVLSTLLTL